MLISTPRTARPGIRITIVSTVVLALLSLSWSGGTPSAQALNIGGWGLAATPPMGWNSWYTFGCTFNEDMVKAAARAMATPVNGVSMKDAGYTYVNLDDCWQVGRDSIGEIVADPKRFPSGMKALADYIHSLGLRFGIYTDAGPLTCANRPGSLRFEYQDAKTYAAWGVDFVKVDWCHTTGLNAKTQYTLWRDAVAASGRTMVLSICNWGIDAPWTWGPSTGHLWRTTGDRIDTWHGFLDVLDKNAVLARHAGPHGWNDPDFLQVGRGGMSDREYRAEFSLWALMAAPLIVSNDVRSMSAYTRETLTNKEVIAVNQDPRGIQGSVVKQDGGKQLQVWSKPLQSKAPASGRNAARAVALFNRTDHQQRMTVNWSDAGLAPGTVVQVRDLWAHRDLAPAEYSRTGYSVTVPAHGVVVLRVVGAER
jgi:alpha-galactosidase